LVLKQEKEEKGNADMLHNKDSERLRTKEEECGKEVETKQRLKWTPRRLAKELKMVRDNLDLISHRHKEEKDLLHENCMLQEEIALLRLEIDTINNQNQQKEKKYFEDIELVKEKTDNLQKIIKLNEEKLKTILQYSGQLNDLIAENKKQNQE
ncbi:hypothetical protein H8957_017670, partial [Semnopithecus entellus]